MGIVIALIIGLAIGLPIAAVILRASISLLNKWLGTEPVRTEVQDDGFGNSSLDHRSDDPFAAPMTRSIVTTSGGGIPEPSFGRAIGIALVAWIVNIAIGFAVALVFGGLVAQGLRIPPKLRRRLEPST